jgi:hypothetical protein
MQSPAGKSARRGSKRGAKAPSKALRGKASTRPPALESGLSRAEARELERHVEDLHDPTRFVLVSTFTKGIVFYYNVSEDTFGWNDPGHATLFKRRPAAEAVRTLLSSEFRVVPCRVDRRGRVVQSSVGESLKQRRAAQLSRAS